MFVASLCILYCFFVFFLQTLFFLGHRTSLGKDLIVDFDVNEHKEHSIQLLLLLFDVNYI